MSTALLRRNRNYRLLFSATAVSNLGDGISALAFPWLASLVTRDPVLISMTAVATRLPWFLFTLPAGVWTDRADRQSLMVRADLFRCLLTFGIVALILSGPSLPLGEDHAALPIILALSALAFLLGTAEVLRDNAAQTMLPSVVEKSDLEHANGQMWSVEQIMGSFVGPPLAGILIALAIPLPFTVDAVTFALAALAVWMIVLPKRAKPLAGASLWADFTEGTRWLWQHRLILRLAIVLGIINAANVAVLTMLVLFSQEILGLSAFGYGVLLTAGAAGGVIGGVIAPGITRRIGGTASLLVAMCLFALNYLFIAVTSSGLMAGLGLFVGMLGALLWNVRTVSFRQRVIPDEILGRVNSIYRFFGWGMMPVGAFGGGLLVAWLEPSWGREAALRAPYWVAFWVSLALAAVIPFALRMPKDD